MRKLIFFLLAVAPRVLAGELMVHPTRLVFDGNTRTAQVDVINSGTETMTYRISVIRRRMTDTGDFVTVDQPAANEWFSDEMIRYSPRQVVLPPGGAQAVRLQIRKPAGLEDGEYRAHLLFQALPPAESHAAPATAAETKDLEIHLHAVYSVSIPVIVRHGATAAEVAIRDVAVRDNAVSFTLDRKGTRSVYGDLIVSLRGARGTERVIARANGVAVYTPNATRRVRLPLAPGLLSAGELHVAFAERREQAGRVEAESRIPVR
ncbi:MAG TPA: molecular chaperone [Thermoanaerobaculia bacterium]|nr:molecular chaperone [Thermoanaerobaculia bacterium]